MKIRYYIAVAAVVGTIIGGIIAYKGAQLTKATTDFLTLKEFSKPDSRANEGKLIEVVDTE